jgi:hypothetical protein
MEDVTFPIDPTQVLFFARAVGYEDQPGGPATGTALPVPPTFTEAVRQFVPEDEFRPRPGAPWIGSAAKPTGLPDGDAEEGKGTLFHAEQHFTYHRPLPVGADVIASFRDGDAWTKRGRRGGELIFRERIAEFRDHEGELLVTSRLVSVETGRPVEA